MNRMKAGGLDHFIATRLVDPALTFCWRDRAGRGLVPILMYHGITDEPEPGVRGYYRLNTPPDLFRDHLRVIRDEGYVAMGLEEAWGKAGASPGHDGEVGAGRRIVVLTFDDGFQDFLTHAWPALEEFGFSATMFLPTAFVGDLRKSFKGRPCLTWAEVRELHSRGAEFGSHTVNHPRLWELSGAEVTAELGESRRTMEQELGVRVTSFAHPYSFPVHDKCYVERFRAALSDADYKLGVTTSLGCARSDDDPLMLKRLPANGADDVALMRAKLHGAYDWLAVPQKAFKSVRGWVGRSPGSLA